MSPSNCVAFLVGALLGATAFYMWKWADVDALKEAFRTLKVTCDSWKAAYEGKVKEFSAAVDALGASGRENEGLRRELAAVDRQRDENLRASAEVTLAAQQDRDRWKAACYNLTRVVAPGRSNKDKRKDLLAKALAPRKAGEERDEVDA
jgi:hypothetical protein